MSWSYKLLPETQRHLTARCWWDRKVFKLGTLAGTGMSLNERIFKRPWRRRNKFRKHKSKGHRVWWTKINWFSWDAPLLMSCKRFDRLSSPDINCIVVYDAKLPGLAYVAADELYLLPLNLQVALLNFLKSTARRKTEQLMSSEYNFKQRWCILKVSRFNCCFMERTSFAKV